MDQQRGGRQPIVAIGKRARLCSGRGNNVGDKVAQSVEHQSLLSKTGPGEARLPKKHMQLSAGHARTKSKAQDRQVLWPENETLAISAGSADLAHPPGLATQSRHGIS
jgi:hypothetical protein